MLLGVQKRRHVKHDLNALNAPQNRKRGVSGRWGEGEGCLPEIVIRGKFEVLFGMGNVATIVRPVRHRHTIAYVVQKLIKR